MENKQNDALSQELALDSASRSLLLAITKWTKLLTAILLMAVSLMLLITGYQVIWGYSGGKDIMQVYFILLYKLLVLAPPALYLFRFSQKMKVAVNTHDQELITASLISLKSFFRFIVVATLFIMIVGTIGLFTIGDGLSFLE